MRKAFSMLTALFVMILMASLAVFILNISSKSVKATVVNYKKEQAVLFAKSYTELAIMAATANESNVTNCAETITGSAVPLSTLTADPENGIGYEIQVDIAYIGNDLACTTPGKILNTTTISTPNALHIIVDTFVRYKPSIDVDAGSSRWITYHRRTLQKL